MNKHLQGFENDRPQVVGCIPYRYKKTAEATSLQGVEKLEVLIITSTKGNGMLFPKGHWKLDQETKMEGASRKALEEAGVRGTLEPELGKWELKCKTRKTMFVGYMFPLLVQEELDEWPDKYLRQRIWMNASDARVVCRRFWMKEALDKLLDRLASHQQNTQNQTKHRHSIDFDLENGNTLPRPLPPRSSEILVHMERMKWTLVLVSLLIEGVSSAFDQMSTPEKPQYALIAMLMAFVGLVIFIIEACFTMPKRNVCWRRNGRIWCSYYPPPNERLFGTIVEKFGLAFAIWQCVYSAIEYVYTYKMLDNPIKIVVNPF